jgi:hypothetical protein
MSPRSSSPVGCSTRARHPRHESSPQRRLMKCGSRNLRLPSRWRIGISRPSKTCSHETPYFSATIGFNAVEMTWLSPGSPIFPVRGRLSVGRRTTWRFFRPADWRSAPVPSRWAIESLPDSTRFGGAKRRTRGESFLTRASRSASRKNNFNVLKF